MAILKRRGITSIGKTSIRVMTYFGKMFFIGGD
jgi:hypothetical protein